MPKTLEALPYSLSPNTVTGIYSCVPSFLGKDSKEHRGCGWGFREILSLSQESCPSAPVPTDHGGFQVHKHRPGHMLASPSLAEERVEGVIPTADGFVTWHLTVRLNSMFKAVQFPAGIADLDTCLPHVDRDALALGTRTQTLRPPCF